MISHPDTRDSLACPRCHSHDVARSRTRGFLERGARIFGLRPFRCMACYGRFFSLGGRIRRDAEDSHSGGGDADGSLGPRGKSANLRHV
jgi:hypothetical protein